MRVTILALSVWLMSLAAPLSNLAAQVARVEAESGSLNGFSIVQGGLFSGGARVDGDVSNPTAVYTFPGWDGLYDVSVRYCDEDDGVSSYQLLGSTAGAVASWDGDITTGSTACGSEGLILREVATSVVLEEGETITFACVRDPGEPCRTDHFDFAYLPPAPPPSLQPAFPGAVGFGAGTTGARGFGAEVCVVANLADSGPGSFRACAEQGPPAYITFAVSGYVDLSDEVNIAANKTIECATAPGDGVVFRKARLHVAGDNTILRGCRVWAGDEAGGQTLSSRDSIMVGDAANSTVRDAIIANSSFMFGTDEVAGTWFPVENVTYQHNIIAWGLRWTDENEEEHNSYGTLIGAGADKVSVIGNLLTLSDFRNPRVAAVTEPVEFVNNLSYCHYHDAVDLDDGTSKTHVVGNVFKGRLEPDGEGCINSDPRYISLTNDSVAYVNDNQLSGGAPATIYVDATSELAAGELFTPSITALPAGAVEELVFTEAGPRQLISFELDVFDHYVDGTGSIIHSVTELGGWPALQGGVSLPDSDGDGMPDWWEMAHCGPCSILDCEPCGPANDEDSDGYENVEEWFHSLY